jgi:hypothetical protein
MIQTIEYLKGKFATGMKPTGQDFTDLIDTLANAEITTSGPATATGKYLTVTISGSALKIPLYQ